MFVYFRLAFNTIIVELLDKLQDKSSQLKLPNSICYWIIEYLTDRPQNVWIGNCMSGTITLSTGAIHSCPFFSPDTKDCTSRIHLSCSSGLQTTPLSKTAYLTVYKQLVTWCRQKKTIQRIIEFRKKKKHNLFMPKTVLSASLKVIQIPEYYLLKWVENTASIIKRLSKRLFFLQQLKKSNLPLALLVQFYTAIIELILSSSKFVWLVLFLLQPGGKCSVSLAL